MNSFLITLLITVSFVCSAQTVYRYDAKGNLIDGSHIQLRNLGEVVLKDSAGITYVLDSVHVSVAAYSIGGKMLWQTDPWKDNTLPEYRTKRPVIVQFRLIKTIPDMPGEFIYIKYNNTQFGVIHKKDGTFDWFGQD